MQMRSVSPGRPTLGSVTRSPAAGPARTATLGESASTLRTPSPSPSTAIQRRSRFSA